MPWLSHDSPCCLSVDLNQYRAVTSTDQSEHEACYTIGLMAYPIWALPIYTLDSMSMNITLCITTIPESVPPTFQSQSNLNAVNYFREGEFFEIELGQVVSALNYKVSMKINGDEVNC